MRRRIIQILQLLFALTFIFSGTAKCIDPTGTSIKIGEYLGYFGFPLSSDYTMAISWVMSVVEFICGFNLMMGHGRIFGLVASSWLMIFFTPLTLWLALTDSIQDCGCFGDIVHLSNVATFFKNLVLCVVLVLLWVNRYCLYRLGGPTAYTLYKYIVLIFLLWLCVVGSIYEPYADFRPYQPDLDLRKAVLSGSEGDVTYTCVYAKDGQEQSFSLDELPDEADEWEFVRTEEHHATAEQTSLDFFARTQEGDDFTRELLSYDDYTILLVSSSLDDASQHDIDKVEKLYEYAQLQSYPFYMLAGPDREQADRWRYNTGAEYPFLFTDQTIAQTICRSNPCVVLLHDGVLCWKKPLSLLNAEALTSAKLNEQSRTETQEFGPMVRFFVILILIIAPFLLFLLIEITQKLHYKQIKDSKDA